MRRQALRLLLALTVLTMGIAAASGAVAATPDEGYDPGSGGGAGDCEEDCTVDPSEPCDWYDDCDSAAGGGGGSGGLLTPQ